MIHLKEIHYKNDESSKEYLEKYLAQFTPERAQEMLGIRDSIIEYEAFTEKALRDPELTEEQFDVIDLAHEIVDPKLKKLLDMVAEMFAKEKSNGRTSKGKKTDNPYAAGFQKGINHFQRISYDLLQGGVFHGKERNIASSHLIAAGMTLADKLKTML